MPQPQKSLFFFLKKCGVFALAFGLVIKFGYLDIKKNFFLRKVTLLATYWIGNICDQKSKIE